MTVEKKEGRLGYQGYDIRVVDLPGVYGLTAYSIDEVIARDFIIDEKPDVVVDVVDALSLERNLYITVQLLEMGTRLIVALNMMDQADSRNFRIDVEQLSNLLGVSVVPMVASRNRGTEELLKEIVNVAESGVQVRGLRVEYGREIEKEIAKLEERISRSALSQRYSPRWLAVKLLEEDEEIIRKFQESNGG